MLSEQYGWKSKAFFQNNRKLFDDVIRHGSWYLLRDLPPGIAAELWRFLHIGH